MTVTIVAGPPAGGKSTYVARRSAPGDLVIDLDEIAGAHDRTAEQTSEALAEVERLERKARRHRGDVWVVRCVPDPAEREALAERLGADRVVVLATSRAEAKRRAVAAGRPREWPTLIDRWWRLYSPADIDDTVGRPSVDLGRSRYAARRR